MNDTKSWVLMMLIIALCSFPEASFAVKSGEIVTWEGGGAGKVVFEGEDHAEEGYTCKDCHPALFQMKKSTAKITMAAMNQGKFCGACHNGKTAFSTSDPEECDECHKQTEKHHKDDSDEDEED